MARVYTTRGGDSIESEKKSLKEGLTVAELWLKKIEKAKADEEDWREEAQEAINVYEAEQDAKGKKGVSPIAFNLFHSNVETLIPALYNSSPVPDVRRRFGDADQVAKHVVDVAERAISFSVDQFDLDGEMKAVLKDGEVAGRGVLRFRYKPSENGGYQKCEAERVEWDRFILGPGKNWARTKWIAFEEDLTREELEELNPAVAKQIGLDSADVKKRDGKPKLDLGVMKTAKVYVIWERKSRNVIFVAENHKEAPLKVVKDPLGLPDFFPAMKPYQPLQRLSSQVPLNPYKIYKSLLDELDEISVRIKRVTRQCKVRGLIDSSMEADLQKLQECADGEYVPSQNSTLWAQGPGGLEKAVAHWPLDPSVKLLAQLYINRENIKQTIYEVTGLSDILRGASDAKETATAQTIKTKWGSLRIQTRQGEAARIARELFRMKVAVFAQPQMYSDEQLSKITGLPDQAKPEQVQMWPAVMQMFRSDLLQFRIDVETNSTVRNDLQNMQEQLNLFIQGVAQYATAIAGLIQIAPAMVPVAIEVFTAYCRNFKLGKQAEDALDSLQQQGPQLAQMLAQQGSPEDAKAKADAEKAKREAEMDGHKLMAQQLQAKLEMQHKERLLQLEMEMKDKEFEHKERLAKLEMEQKTMELQLKRASGEMEMEHRADELANQSMGNVMSFDAKQQGAKLDNENKDKDVQRADELHEVKKRAAGETRGGKPEAKKPKGPINVDIEYGKDGKVASVNKGGQVYKVNRKKAA